MKKLVIIGASGHGRVIADIARLNGYNEISFLDDNDTLKKCGDYNVIGKSDLAYSLSCEVIVGIGNAKIREQFMERLESLNVKMPSLVHPNAVIGENVSIGKGTVVMAGTVINPGTIIGKGCIINTCSSVDHDCVLDNYVHISVGAHLAGTVTVEERSWIGIGATISNNLNITNDCVSGAGAVVIKDIEESGTYVGVPACKIK